MPAVAPAEETGDPSYHFIDILNDIRVVTVLFVKLSGLNIDATKDDSEVSWPRRNIP